MTELVQVQVVAAPGAQVERVVVGAFEGSEPRESLPPRWREPARTLAARPGWKGSAGQHAEALVGSGRRQRVLVLHGLGPRASFDLRALRGVLRQVVADAQTNRVRRLALALPEHAETTGGPAGERILRELMLAGYKFTDFRKPDRTRARLPVVELVAPPGETRAWRAAMSIAAAIAHAAGYARDLANTPPNVANPDWLVRQARALAKRCGAQIAVLGPRELARRGMGGLLAVGGGSAQLPRLVRLQWGRGGKTVALVGKGVTFDTGGISIKPAAQMDEMKYDKCGACTVLGIFRAAAELRLPVRLRAYLPLAENMPGSRAYRPGDIVRCANGKTVEIVNTDAEGRMILADALSWAAAEKPDHLVEMSTLTGACVVALGTMAAGAYTPDDALASGLLAAAEAAGERLWRLPVWPEFVDEMKGLHGDLKNSGGRWGGANTAAGFLSQFMEPVKSWAHLDIAGPAYVGGDTPASGATGYGVASVIGWLRAVASH